TQQQRWPQTAREAEQNAMQLSLRSEILEILAVIGVLDAELIVAAPGMRPADFSADVLLVGCERSRMNHSGGGVGLRKVDVLVTDQKFHAVACGKTVVDGNAERICQQAPAGGQKRILRCAAVRVIRAEANLFQTSAVGDGGKLVADVDGPLRSYIAKGVEV